MKVVLHSCGPEPMRLARLEVTKTALELAGHEAQIITAGIGVPRSTWAAAPSAMILSSARINNNLRADLGVAVYAGKTGQKRSELLALFDSFGVQVATAVVVASLDELLAKLAQFGDVAVWLKPQSALRVSDLRENNWDEIQSPAPIEPVPLNRNHRRPVLVTPDQASYPELDGPVIAMRDPNPNDGNSFRAVLLFGQVLLLSRTSELPLNQRLLPGVNEDGTRAIAWHKTIVEQDANTVTITPTAAQRTALEAVSNQLTALGYGAVELELKRAANGNLVLMDFEDGNRVGGRWANEQTGFLDRFAAAVVAKANAD
jgi:hypothetical protein